MTILRDILTESTLIAGKPISDMNFLQDFNRAMNDLAMLYDTAKIRDIKTINCTDTLIEYDLTLGCLRIERVLDSNGNYFKNFIVRGNSKILILQVGTFYIHETFAPSNVVTMDDTISINPAYISAITKFIAARALRKVSPEYTTMAGKRVRVSSPESYQELMSQFSSDAMLANNNIRKVNNPNRKVRANRYR